MTKPITTAFRILGHFWLEEVKPDDLVTIAALPELAQTLSNTETTTLTNLAVEYQRLFGFNLPPYESVFIDSSAMLMAPSTERIQTLYRQGGWELPKDVRAGAPDHLGAELLALADWQDAPQPDLAHRLHARHLALWAPVFVITLRRLAPHPFYQMLGDLTLDLLLSTLPKEYFPTKEDLFPLLPPAPISRGSDEGPLGAGNDAGMLSPAADPAEIGLREIVRHLLSARETGLYLTRNDLASIGESLDLPGVMGERHRMLDSLFRQAGQYDLVPDLFEQLEQIITNIRAAYRCLADEYPLWLPYARVWESQLEDTWNMLNDMQVETAQFGK